MEPMVFARLVDAARIKPGEVALDLAAGTGYGAAVLARLATTVVAVEPDAGLADIAGRALIEAGAENVVLVLGDPQAGHAAQAPYDVIVFEGAVPEVPNVVLGQLGENGRLVAVVRRADAVVGEATLFERHRGHVSRRALFEAAVPALPGVQREPGFVF
jgi:protein-L-isoaspartate(D-aspartate) O-methyltransferase